MVGRPDVASHQIDCTAKSKTTTHFRNASQYCFRYTTLLTSYFCVTIAFFGFFPSRYFFTILLARVAVMKGSLE
jgi:hypothetical protein